MRKESIETLQETGHVWFRSALSQDMMAELDEWVDVSDRPGQRLAAAMPSAAISAITEQISKCLPAAFPTRAVAFSKTGQSNWSVPWHQDRVIAVGGRHDMDGYENWSNKDGIWHCQPPLAILEQMVFVRVHLDDTDLTNGCMEVAPGSHRHGLILENQVQDIATQAGSQACIAKRGDVQVLKMLLLHRSRPAKDPRRRRAVRIDFASIQLPRPLEWFRFEQNQRAKAR